MHTSLKFRTALNSWSCAGTESAGIQIKYPQITQITQISVYGLDTAFQIETPFWLGHVFRDLGQHLNYKPNAAYNPPPQSDSTELAECLTDDRFCVNLRLNLISLCSQLVRRSLPTHCALAKADPFAVGLL